MGYVSLHAHSQYSLLDGLSKAPQMALRIRQLGQTACALTDHGTVSGVVSFQKAMQAACKHCGHQPKQHADGGKGACQVRGVVCPGYEKSPLKAILGNEFYICPQDAKIKGKENDRRAHLVVLAKNLEGWRNLVQASSASAHPEHFYRKPRLDLEKLAAFGKGQWLTFSGHMGSDLADICFPEPRLAYAARTYEQARAAAKPWPDLKRDVLALAGKYQELFGKGNFWLEIQLIDSKHLPASLIVAKTLRWASKQLGIPCVATPDAHYPGPNDAGDQRVLLCSSLDTTLAEANHRLAMGEDVGLGGFFRSNRYYLPSTPEMEELHEPAELANTLAMAEACADYDITSKPRLPRFDCPDGLTPDQYLRVLCEKGWPQKVAGQVEARQHGVYRDRLERELGVLTEAGLSPYFLIVDDYCRYARDQLRCKPSKGRGSGAGSLVLHLLGVTDCDPIRYGLLFERFYNAGRNAPGRISLPDVDCDFPISLRGQVISYIQQKYGSDRVSQMATFGRMQGREALTAVFRAHGWGTTRCARR
jgi:DNA polymerase-3 subunit alpha